tara:strand:+ start:204 stop:491 length:288 start_codon:yes stop_codon:yes gene_type:complete
MRLIFELIDKGFKPFRKVGSEYKRCINTSFFSSVESGMIDIRLLKEGKEIIIGLLEPGHPPTLIQPSLGYGNMEIETKLSTMTIDNIIDLTTKNN